MILPLTILRRLDCILEPDRETVRKLAARYDNPTRLRIEVKKATGRPFHNTSNYSFANLLGDADGLADNLVDYLDRFSPDVDVFEYFDFKKELLALEKAGLLREVITSFKAVDLHPDVASNADMGDAFEYIIRKFNEAANETSGDHYTPRDAIRLLVDLLFAEKDVDLSEADIVRTLYDPTAGTGGMLALGEEHLLEHNPDAKLSLFGQEYNPQSYAICKSDLLAKGHDATNIAFGNTLTDDAFKGRQFDFCMSNPAVRRRLEAVRQGGHEPHTQHRGGCAQDPGDRPPPRPVVLVKSAHHDPVVGTDTGHGVDVWTPADRHPRSVAGTDRRDHHDSVHHARRARRPPRHRPGVDHGHAARNRRCDSEQRGAGDRRLPGGACPRSHRRHTLHRPACGRAERTVATVLCRPGHRLR